MRTNAKIYVMQAEDGTIKLGHSVRPQQRAKQIGRCVAVVHETETIEQVERIERLAHRVLALHGSHLRGEWFEATLEQAIAAIEIATRQAEKQELELGGPLKRAARMGRPPLDQPMHQINIHLTPEMLREVDAVIAERAGQASRGAVIREMLVRGLRSYRQGA